MMSTKVKTREEVRSVISAPILGEIVSKGDEQAGKEIVVSPGANDPVSESFRIVRSSMRFINGGDTKVISTSSTIPGEGKSYFAINLAITLSLPGARVCMLDLDLRRRKLTYDVDLKNRKGITDYLVSKYDILDDIIIKTDYAENLYVIPAGCIPPNPAELLAGERFDRLMGGLRKRFDYIITDNPPANVVADGAISNRHTDITCYVVRLGFLDRRELPYIEELYQTSQFKNLSLVLTDVPNSKRYEYK